MLQIYIEIRYLLISLRRRIWNKMILLWWYRLWVRKNEFHKSLDFDFEAMMVMNQKGRKKYWKDLAKRRQKAHERDLKSTVTKKGERWKIGVKKEQTRKNLRK